MSDFTPEQEARFRKTTESTALLSWTFLCKFCNTLRSLRGHKKRKRNGKWENICHCCLTAEGAKK